MKWFCMFIALCLPVTAAFSIELRQFDDPEKAERYNALVKDLRCLVCQNQSLADSDADLARDLRDEVYRIIQDGKSMQEASQFLVDRYGDFVLYRPPFKWITLLLWSGPLALLILAVIMVWRQACSRRAQLNARLMSDDDRKKLLELTNRIKG